MTATGKGLVAVVIAAAVMGSAIVFAQGNLATLSAVTPAEMKFVSNTGRPGSTSAVLIGDPAKPGIYVMHVRLPANIKIEPHSHSELWRRKTHTRHFFDSPPSVVKPESPDPSCKVVYAVWRGRHLR